MRMSYAPLRTLQDVEELERVPLEQRVFSWNLNDWIARGCGRDPDKIAIRYIADGDPERAALVISYRELQARGIQAANLFHSLGVTGNASSTVITLGISGSGSRCRSDACRSRAKPAIAPTRAGALANCS